MMGMAGAHDTVMQLAINPRLMGRNLTRDMQKMQATLGRNLGQVMSEAAGGRFTDKMAAEVRKKFESLQSDLKDSREKAERAAEKLRDTAISVQERLQQRAILDSAKLEYDALLKRYKAEEDNVKAVASRRVKSYDKELETVGMKMGQNAESFGESLHDIFSDLTSKDLGSMLQIISKMGQKAKSAGDMARAGQGVGTTGKVLDKVGGVLGKIGPALMAIGAVVAGFAAVIKLIIDADAQAKELHRTLMESGTSLGDMVGGAQNVKKAFDEVRDAAVDLRNNYKWGTLAADQLKILGAFNNTVYTLKKMGDGLGNAEDRMKAYQQATSAALIYSKLLGESAETVTQQMGDMMEELGLSLTGVKEKFAAIYDAAQSSGYGTKRFFGMVLQATTGMSMYNVRLEQTSAMLLSLNKILGSKFGQEFFSKLTQGFSKQSAQEGMKTIMMAGADTVGKALSGTAKYAADGFVDIFEKSIKPGGDFGDALSKAFNIDGKKLAADLKDRDKRETALDALVGKLKQMDPKAFASAVATVTKDSNSNVARGLQQLRTQAKGIGGDLGDQMQALRALDPGAALVMHFKVLEKWTKKTPEELQDLGAINQMFAENSLGMDTEMQDQLKNIGISSVGAWKEMSTLKDKQLSPADLEKEQAKQVAAWGAFSDKSGKIWAGKLDENGKAVATSMGPLKDVYDLMSGRVSADQKVNEVMSKQEALAQQVASNTTEMTKILEQGVQAVLNKIYTAVQGIWGKMGGLSEGEQKAQRKALEAQDAIIKSLQERQRELAMKASTAELGVKTATTPEEKLAKQKELDTLNSEMDRNRQRIADETELSKAIQNQTSSNWTFDKKASEFLSEAQKMREDQKKAPAAGTVVTGEQVAGGVSGQFMKDISGIAKWVSGVFTDGMEGVEKTDVNLSKKEEIQNKYEDKKMEDKRIATAKNKLNPDLAKKIAEENQKGSLKSALAAGGVPTNMIDEVAEAIMGGRPAGINIAPDKAQELLDKFETTMGPAGASKFRVWAGAQKDFMARIDGGGAIRDVVSIDDQDTIMGVKPGGAVAKAGRKVAGKEGSGKTVINYFTLNDTGRGALKVIQDAQDAGAL